MGGIDDCAVETVSVYQGVPSDPVSQYFAMRPVISFPYGWASAGFNYAGCFDIDSTDPNVSAIFVDSTGGISGYRFEQPGGYKIVNLYWPFTDLVNHNGSPDSVSQDTLLLSVLRWFGVTGVEEDHQTEVLAQNLGFRLWQNSPNPAVGRTTISFNIPSNAHVELGIFDMSGRLTATLLSGRMPAGSHSVQWNGRREVGTAAPSGIYFCRLEVCSEGNAPAGGFSATRKLILIR
jgi:hypothetical protein